MKFDEALEAIQHGQRVKRAEWSEQFALELEDVAAEDWEMLEEDDDEDDDYEEEEEEE